MSSSGERSIAPNEIRVALVAPADPRRLELAGYLRRSGFDVYECEELGVASRFIALVTVTPPDVSPKALVADVRLWLLATKIRRVVVATTIPNALRDLVVVHDGRLRVLPEPAGGWDLVNALSFARPQQG